MPTAPEAPQSQAAGAGESSVCEEGVTSGARGDPLQRGSATALYLLVSRTLQELLLQLPFFLRYLSHFKIYLEEKKMH